MTHQDVQLFVAYLMPDHSINYHFQENRLGWLQLIKGEIEVNEQRIQAGDGIAIKDEKIIQLKCIKEAELLLFDLKNS